MKAKESKERRLKGKGASGTVGGGVVIGVEVAQAGRAVESAEEERHIAERGARVTGPGRWWMPDAGRQHPPSCDSNLFIKIRKSKSEGDEIEHRAKAYFLAAIEELD